MYLAFLMFGVFRDTLSPHVVSMLAPVADSLLYPAQFLILMTLFLFFDRQDRRIRATGATSGP